MGNFELNLLNYQQSNTEKGIDHVPYEIESHIMSCIRNGTPEELYNYDFDRLEGKTIGHMAYYGKNDEYGAVVAVSLAARAAIDGGLSPQTCYDMNDLFLQRISILKKSSDYEAIIHEAFQTFSNAVRDKKKPAVEPKYISLCKEYIFRHISMPFSLDDLASYVNLSNAYLSDSFHEYTGMTITEYTKQQRIEAAIVLLDQSDHTILEISNFLCFNSQSYFCKVFREITGITPARYRRLHEP